MIINITPARMKRGLEARVMRANGLTPPQIAAAQGITESTYASTEADLRANELEAEFEAAMNMPAVNDDPLAFKSRCFFEVRRNGVWGAGCNKINRHCKCAAALTANQSNKKG